MFSRLAWDIGAHIPRVRDGEKRLIAQLGHLPVPFFLGVSCGIEVADLLLAQLGQSIDDPVSLAFDTAGTIAEGGWALSSVH